MTQSRSRSSPAHSRSRCRSGLFRLSFANVFMNMLPPDCSLLTAYCLLKWLSKSRSDPRRPTSPRLRKSSAETPAMSHPGRRLPDPIVRQNEFAQIGTVKRGFGPDGRSAESRRLRIRVRVERRVGNRAAARPETATRHFVRIRFARHRSGRLGMPPGCSGAGRPENRVTARSGAPQK